MKTLLLGKISAALLVLCLNSNARAAQGGLPTARAQSIRPLMFEPNQGQVDPSVAFISHGKGYTMLLSPAEVIVALHDGPPITSLKTQFRNRIQGLVAEKSANPAREALIRMSFVGANPDLRLTPLEPLPAHINYLTGNDPSLWHQNIPAFARLQSRDVYPGIDLVYYGTEGQLEFDFVIQPGADPARIQFTVEGADDLRIDAHGDLVIRAGNSEMHHHKPVIYQQEGGTRRNISGGYVLKGKSLVAFELGAYDHSKNLTIDPTLWYSTYFGSSTNIGLIGRFGGGTDVANGIAVTPNGTTYVVGTTDGTGFLVGGGTNTIRLIEFRSTVGKDVFVAKYSATTSTNDPPILLNLTFLGGSGDDDGEGIALDPQGNVYVTGVTTSTNFPVTAHAPQQFLADSANPAGGAGDAFVAKLTIPDSGSPTIVYSTYLGGVGKDAAFAIAVDANQNAYVAGSTISSNFPTTFGAFQRHCSSCPNAVSDAFVAKLSPTGSQLVYSTLLGGSSEDIAFGVAVPTNGGPAMVTGAAFSTNFPVTSAAFQKTRRGVADAFVTEVGAFGTNLVWSTFLGGSGGDVGESIVFPGFLFEFAVVTGWTDSRDFPVKNAFQPTSAVGTHAFVTAISKGGGGLGFSTYLGGSGTEFGFGITKDPANNLYVTGFTTSTNFPTLNAIQNHLAGSADVFVTEFSLTGTNLFSTYFGGSDSDTGEGIAVDGTGRAYIAGYTSSADFPVRNAVQGVYTGGNSDGFVAKLGGLAHAATLANLLVQVESLDLNNGLINSLRSVLEQAQISINSGRAATASSQLGAFVAHLQDLADSGQLDAEIAQSLIAQAEAIAGTP